MMENEEIENVSDGEECNVADNVKTNDKMRIRNDVAENVNRSEKV